MTFNSSEDELRSFQFHVNRLYYKIKYVNRFIKIKKIFRSKKHIYFLIFIFL